ncbi:hypothetical protein IQ07DRAFT_560443 [Pyrenochaeta sp. DS3sAY3a]|nr:hypothetical protein IQ07DRAFT_560443 [Pyrenochaeta sp. DS3sAY3a]
MAERNEHDGKQAGNSSTTLEREEPSLDLTQRLERKLGQLNASQNPWKRWLLEICCWILSALSMGGIIGIYLFIRGKDMVASAQGLTFANALGKIAAAALIVPTSEALGQLKWNWFNSSQAIWDFEIFDKASRGPWGAALLLYRTKGRSLAALGALLIVLLLAIDTFFQQVVSYQDRWALQQTSSALPRVINYRPPFVPAFRKGFEITSEDRALGAAAREFFFDDGIQPVPFGNGTRPDIPVTCPTSNCTWPPYETLAVCSSCTDVSKTLNLTFTCINTTMEWSAVYIGPLTDAPFANGTVCGYFLNATSPEPILLSGYNLQDTDSGNSSTSYKTGEALVVRTVPLTDFNTRAPLYGSGSINYKHIKNPILDALIASAPDGSQSVYEHQAPVIHDENVTAVYLNTASEPTKWPWETFEIEFGTFFIYAQNITLSPPTSNSSSLQPSASNPTYHLDNMTIANTINFFDDFFPSFYTAATPSAKPRVRYRNYNNWPTSQELIFNPWQAPNNITRHMDRLAKAMTNVMRSSTSKVMLNGKSFEVEKFVSIKWEWLTFPIILLLLTLVFLVCTIIKTADDKSAGTWKTSAMPTLIYSLPKETQSQMKSTSTWNSTKETKKVRIRLLPNMGWRVSGQNQINASPTLRRMEDGTACEGVRSV